MAHGAAYEYPSPRSRDEPIDRSIPLQVAAHKEKDAQRGGLDVARDVTREDDDAIARERHQEVAKSAAGIDVESGGGLVHD